MIQLVCPGCNGSSDKVRTKVVVEAFGYICIVSCRDSGVERAVSSPLRTSERTPKANITPGENYTCIICGDENLVEKWKYNIVCDHCGRLLTKKPIKNPSSVVDKHICRDTMTIYCDRCWNNYSKEYCSECRFHETCLSYNQR